MSDYFLDNYGTCDREADCYWGKDKNGKWNGCLKVAWKGRACPHWHPLGVTTSGELDAALRQTYHKKDVKG